MLIIKAFVILLLISVAAEADIYKYVDENGVVFYTDAPFEKKAKRIKKEKKNAGTASNVTGQNKQKSSYSGIIKEKADKYDMDPSLVHAVIKTESGGNPHAVSRKGAMGLMQLMPTTANDLQVNNPFDPEENIDGGTRYLRYLLKRFNGDLTLALAAYNAGSKVVEKFGDVPPISETRQYVKNVLSLYNGRSNYSSALPDSLKAKKAEPIYKIVMEDGTVLFTNTPLYKTSSSRF